MRTERFTFLCSKRERQMIAIIAKHLHRSQGDAIRFLINQVCSQIPNHKQIAVSVDLGGEAEPALEDMPSITEDTR